MSPIKSALTKKFYQDIHGRATSNPPLQKKVSFKDDMGALSQSKLSLGAMLKELKLKKD